VAVTGTGFGRREVNKHRSHSRIRSTTKPGQSGLVEMLISVL
jgi:hypothetical protein